MLDHQVNALAASGKGLPSGRTADKARVESAQVGKSDYFGNQIQVEDFDDEDDHKHPELKNAFEEDQKPGTASALSHMTMSDRVQLINSQRKSGRT